MMAMGGLRRTVVLLHVELLSAMIIKMVVLRADSLQPLRFRKERKGRNDSHNDILCQRDVIYSSQGCNPTQ